MTREIVKREVNLIPADADKHTRYRLGKFERWRNAQDAPWYEPDLAAYRDYMLAEGYATSTVRAHLSTVRAQYQRIARSNMVRDILYRNVPSDCQAPADQKAWVDETITRLRNAADPANSSVKAKKSQDKPDADQLRLTREQAEALMQRPGLDTLKGLRDTAVIALMLCTGIREAELSALDVPDLRQHREGDLALQVREGKGCKQRVIPYGELSWVLVIVESWLRAAGIEGGPVFRGLYKGGYKLRPGRLSVRAIGYILADYPIAIAGELTTVKPHDLRRTYARRFYNSKGDLAALQQNLGHEDPRTTMGYIGDLEPERRRPPALYSFNLNGLLKQAEMGL